MPDKTPCAIRNCGADRAPDNCLCAAHLDAFSRILAPTPPPPPETRPKGPHPSTLSLLAFFDYGHLPLHLQAVSRPFSVLAHEMAEAYSGPELSAGLRKLLEAKDCFVRCAVSSRPGR